MLASPLAFPLDQPAEYETLTNEPVYDPGVHLALQKPDNVESLADFGYPQSEIDQCPSPVAVAGPFRVLSDEGTRAVKQVLDQLRCTAESDEGNRAPNYLAGGVYKSRFLRDLCQCPVLIQMLSEVAGTQLAVHSIPHQQLYVNFAPEDVSKAVDNWHIDSIDFDCVILLEDPSTFEGGHFQYFRGTDEEAAKLFDTSPEQLPRGFPIELPEERVATVQKENPGDAVFQQGSRVVHRAEKLHRAADRTTLVISYVNSDVNYRDMNNIQEMLSWHHPGTAPELARHCAWRAQTRLSELTETLSIKTTEADVLKQLKFAVKDVNHLIGLLDQRQK
ncbi:hypothetical protein HBA55_01895 [Pseudomaricurvus alkylphenolicus]|uniref:HalD/BesD family halogenase n=1 Tax=Pseudomaricurvus alkylphenolicus TaxID=1306991 RepID=UPI00141E94E4|nr:hypothetical protein [Pseudomaricurvus alkylphenolicus]NIB38316.1 hypothetical protein [Pseudomaricurvus alkylphenolicus]